MSDSDSEDFQSADEGSDGEATHLQQPIHAESSFPSHIHHLCKEIHSTTQDLHDVAVTQHEELSNCNDDQGSHLAQEFEDERKSDYEKTTLQSSEQCDIGNGSDFIAEPMCEPCLLAVEELCSYSGTEILEKHVESEDSLGMVGTKYKHFAGTEDNFRDPSVSESSEDMWTGIGCGLPREHPENDLTLREIEAAANCNNISVKSSTSSVDQVQSKDNIENDVCQGLSVETVDFTEHGLFKGRSINCKSLDSEGDATVSEELNSTVSPAAANVNASGKESETFACGSMKDLFVCQAQDNRTMGSSDSTDVADDWGWEGWAEGLVQQATTGVTSLVEMVESQLGIPSPAEILQNVEKGGDGESKSFSRISPVISEDNAPSAGSSSWFSGFGAVSALTNLVHGSSQDVIAGGIGALEFIGKTTVDLLSSGDPGFRSRREALAGKKSTLSAVLQEARTKEPSADGEGSLPGSIREGQTCGFNSCFDKFQGFAHLDALEMLSNECERKLERILSLQSDEASEESRVTLMQIQHHFDVLSTDPDHELSDSDFKKEVFAIVKGLELKVMSSKLLNTWVKLKEGQLASSSSTDPILACDVCNEAVSSVAEFASRCIELYRKIADMLVLTDMAAKQRGPLRALGIRKLTALFLMEITKLSSCYADRMVALQGCPGNKDASSRLITDLYIEVANGSSYIGDAHKLLLPILQCSVIK